MIAANVGIGILPESVTRRYAQSNPLTIIELSDKWAERAMQICLRNFDELPSFAKTLIALLAADAAQAQALTCAGK